jgi:hypothetical protein
MKNRYRSLRKSGLSLLAVAMTAFAVHAAEPANAPGSRPAHTNSATKNIRRPGPMDSSSTSLQEFYSASGTVYLSVDGLGTNEASGTIDVEKRSATSVVRQAFLLAASTGFGFYPIPDNELTLQGVSVNVDESTLLANGIDSYNVRADVTNIVKPVVDAAAPGRISLTLAETLTYNMDGEILAVVFDDPAEPDGSISLLYGAQNPLGDSFAVRLSDPIDASNANQKLSFSLGISYGFQGSTQYSTVDVNGNRLTSSAGGQDDGAGENGALLTVGGLDDSTDNPVDPYADPGACGEPPRCDDELYDLKAVLADGTTTITVATNNLSNDDNIFFAAFSSSGLAAVINEGIVLSPSSQEVDVGVPAPLVAVVQDSLGNGVPDKDVTFTVSSGPDAGLTTDVVTGSDGSANQSITCSAAGTDVVSASFVDSHGTTKQSNEVSIICDQAAVVPTQMSATAVLGVRVIVMTAVLQSADGNSTPISGKTIDFSNAQKWVCSGVTNSNGIATCSITTPLIYKTAARTYTATFAGDDTALAATATAPVTH